MKNTLSIGARRHSLFWARFCAGAILSGIGATQAQSASAAALKALSKIFALVTLLTLGYWTAVVAKARLDQRHKKLEFAVERTKEINPPVTLSKPPPSLPWKPTIGSAIAMLEIRRVGISAVVLEGAAEGELRLGPGHILGTSLPGEGGNVGVAGHRDSSFRPLRHLQPNDLIKLTTSVREYCHRVESMEIVSPADVHVLDPAGREMLTLVTCYPFTFIGHAPKRFIVRADYGDCSS